MFFFFHNVVSFTTIYEFIRHIDDDENALKFAAATLLIDDILNNTPPWLLAQYCVDAAKKNYRCDISKQIDTFVKNSLKKRGKYFGLKKIFKK